MIMSNLLTRLSDEVFDNILLLEDEETENIRQDDNMPLGEVITRLIGGYLAAKSELIDREEDLIQLQAEYEAKLEETKNRIMTEEDIKATPAKLRAREELREQEDKIRCIQGDINILKAHIQAIKYQLTYRNMQYKRETRQLQMEE